MVHDARGIPAHPPGTLVVGPPDFCLSVPAIARSACPCADRSCPSRPDDTTPAVGEPVGPADTSWFRRAVKTNRTCGCVPGYDLPACRSWRAYGDPGAMPPCCVNRLPGAPSPPRAFSKAEWDVFSRATGLPPGTYGTCPLGQGDQCAPANESACLMGCTYPDTTVGLNGAALPIDSHPTAPAGGRQTCRCFRAGYCVGGSQDGAVCPASGTCPGGRCSLGGGAIWDAAWGAAPLLYGDCECRNATEDEWARLRWSPSPSASAALANGAAFNWTGGPLPAGLTLRATWWTSNPCPYTPPTGADGSGGGVQWSGTGCRLVKVPFRKHVFGWGDTRAGQLSRNILSVTAPDDQPVNVPRPIELPSLTGLDLVAIAAGNFHAAAIIQPQARAGPRLRKGKEPSEQTERTSGRRRRDFARRGGAAGPVQGCPEELVLPLVRVYFGGSGPAGL